MSGGASLAVNAGLYDHGRGGQPKVGPFRSFLIILAHDLPASRYLLRAASRNCKLQGTPQAPVPACTVHKVLSQTVQGPCHCKKSLTGPRLTLQWAAPRSLPLRQTTLTYPPCLAFLHAPSRFGTVEPHNPTLPLHSADNSLLCCLGSWSRKAWQRRPLTEERGGGREGRAVETAWLDGT